MNKSKDLEATSWIERWLDNVSERGYQTAFIAALVRSGYTILHSTSHNSMELGKDVIAKSKSGAWYAFQLKGNPGRRFTMSQWHDHLGQLLQLCGMPFRDIVNAETVVSFFPVLVTNGEVEEDVQAAVALFNESNAAKTSNTKLVVWNRGKLIDLFLENGVWPTSPKSQISLLKGLVIDYRESMPMEDVQELVESLLWEKIEVASKDFFLSSCISGYMAINILVSRYIDHGNYYESLKIKAYYYCNMVAAGDKIGISSQKYKRFRAIVRHELFTELDTYLKLLCDKFGNTPLINDEIFGEFAIHLPRRIIVQALFAIDSIERRDSIDEKILNMAVADVNYKFFTHEGVLPAFLSIFWAKEIFLASRVNEIELIRVCLGIQFAAGAGQLYSPYYSLEDVVSHQNKDFLGRAFDHLDGAAVKNRSYFMRPIFYMLARRNWKQTCKNVWNQFTYMQNCEFEISELSEFARFRSGGGVNREEYMPHSMTWDELILKMSNSVTTPRVPLSLKDDIPFLMLYINFFPFRSSEALIAKIDRFITKAWY